MVIEKSSELDWDEDDFEDGANVPEDDMEWAAQVEKDSIYKEFDD